MLFPPVAGRRPPPPDPEGRAGPGHHLTIDPRRPPAPPPPPDPPSAAWSPPTPPGGDQFGGFCPARPRGGAPTPPAPRRISKYLSPSSSAELARPAPRTSEASTSVQLPPGGSAAQAREPQTTAGRPRQSTKRISDTGTSIPRDINAAPRPTGRPYGTAQPRPREPSERR